MAAVTKRFICGFSAAAKSHAISHFIEFSVCRVNWHSTANPEWSTRHLYLGPQLPQLTWLKQVQVCTPVFLSKTTSLPDGQSKAFSIAFSLTFGSFDLGIASQMSPPRWQKRAEAQRISASFNFNSGPSISLPFFRKAHCRLFQSHQNSLSHGCCRKMACYWIARIGTVHNFPGFSSFFRIIHLVGSPCASHSIVAVNKGMPPETRYGPFLITVILQFSFALEFFGNLLPHIY